LSRAPKSGAREALFSVLSFNKIIASKTRETEKSKMGKEGLQVINAGFSKTGTKSMNAILEVQKMKIPKFDGN
jgi:hypothetical protein